MTAPRQPKKTNPTTRVAVLIVVIVLIVIGTLAYNARKGKHDYDEQNAVATSSALPASAPAASQ